MARFGKLATLVTAAEAARRYARKNPAQAGKFLDQAAAFVDKQTKGKFSAKIDDAARKVKGVAGIPTHQPPTQYPPTPYPQQPPAPPTPGPVDGRTP